jgi:hypothetical protein
MGGVTGTTHKENLMRERSSSARWPRRFTDTFGKAAFLVVCAGLGGCISDDAMERELRADAAAIQKDKAQLDIDSRNGPALARDQHQLWLDVEKQEHDRGTEDDEFAEGEW